MIILIDSGNSRLKVGWLDPSSPDMPREPAAVTSTAWTWTPWTAGSPPCRSGHRARWA